jgi:hypothetical protein
MVVQNSIRLKSQRYQILLKVRSGRFLPEYYTSEYPNLVKFLEYYYDFMNKNDTHNFDLQTQNLNKIRDLWATDEISIK